MSVPTSLSTGIIRELPAFGNHPAVTNKLETALETALKAEAALEISLKAARENVRKAKEALGVKGARPAGCRSDFM
jgi:hypothetical protein